MAKYKHYDYCQSALIPVSLEDQLMPGTLEFAIHTLVETRMDTSIFDERYKNDETGRPAYDPKVLLKIVLFGYSRGLISSRKLERACRENVVFMALSCGQQIDHSTIATFVSSMSDEILPLYRDVLLVCHEEGLLGGTHFSLDGCKLSSNASRACSGTVSDLARKKEKLEKKVKGLLKEQMRRDKKEDEEKRGSSSGQRNRERQIERLQRRADRIEKFLKENGPKIGKQGRELKSNVTDNESAMMVGIHGIIQGYNGQALVDSKHQVIIHGEVFGTGDDHDLVAPMLAGAKENLEAMGPEGVNFTGKILSADSNYHSPKNLSKCDEEKIDAYIPDKRFRRRDPNFGGGRRRARRGVDRFTLKDFQYDGCQDQYICPKGKVLRLKVKAALEQGVIYRRYGTEIEDCQGCELKVRCIRAKKGQRKTLSIDVGYTPDNLSRTMAAKIDTEKGRRIYTRRMAIVEPVFANIRTHKSMNRFTLRGKIKVNVQWLFYGMIHNIGKILRYGFT